MPSHARLGRPRTDQPHYGEHLGDVDHWGRYVHAALDRAGIGRIELAAPFVGTFPTFLAGDLVVKLFGDTFDGGAAFAAERAMLRLLSGAGADGIRAPELIDSGHLYPTSGPGWSWPYLIMERLSGRPLREHAAITDRAAVAELGEAVARLHRLPVPAEIAARDPIPGLRADAVPRLRRFGLPEHLVEQVPEFLADASAERVLVHADLTEDHVFLDRQGLAGIIDWADAIPADPWYELVALRFDALRSDPELFATLLDGFGLQRDESFPVRALQGVLEFRYDAIGTIAGLVDLSRVRTLTELAHRLC